MIKGENFICFAEDWRKHPTSSQHILKKFLNHNDITWVNSVGYRSPKFSLRDLGRIFTKFWHWITQPQDTNNTKVKIISLIVLPFFHVNLIRLINRRLMMKSISKQGLEKKAPILWLAFPTTADMVGRLGEKLSIYYCGDEFSEIPGVKKEAIKRMEKELLEKADLVFVSSNELFNEKKKYNEQTHLINHGVDFEHFQKAKQKQQSVPKELSGIKKPVIGYYGHISEWVDLELIRFLAISRPQYSFVLIGKAFVDTSILKGINNLILIGPRPYEELPGYVGLFEAAIIPFRSNMLTRFVNPLKLLEYFAAEKPVIATMLPEYDRYKEAMLVAETKEEFLKILDEVIAEFPKGMVEQAKQVAAEQTWEIKAEQISKIIEERINKS